MLTLFLFIEPKILPVNMIYFDTVSNLMHDIWKGLAPSPKRALFLLSQMKFASTTQGMPLKEIIFGKKLSWKFSDALFQELEQCYGIQFLQIGEIYLNQSLKKKLADFYLRLFQIGMTMLQSTP